MMMLLILIIGAIWFFALTFQVDYRGAKFIGYVLSAICLVLAVTSFVWWV